MPVVIDDSPFGPRPAVYPPAPPGTPPSAGGGAPNPPSVPPGAIWHGGTPGKAGTAGRAGYTPDYIALYHASPQYRAWLASATGRMGTFASNRAAAIRELLRQYGGVPANWQDAYGDIRAEDVAAAGANQFSDVAMLTRNYNLGVEQMRRALAARGVLQSGDLDIGQGEADYARGQAESQAFGKFMGAVQGAVGDYTGGTQGILAEETPLMTDVMPGVVEANPVVTPIAGTPPVAPTPGYWEYPPPPPPRAYTAPIRTTQNPRPAQVTPARPRPGRGGVGGGGQRIAD